jgi:asparagine synthetase B (glutamine-hydrolysing)
MNSSPFCGHFHVPSATLTGSPRPSVCQGLHLLFHGNITNPASITEQAQLNGFPLSKSPAVEHELLAVAYRIWEERLSLHVLGEFSMALCDLSRRRLVLCGDTLGMYPLFYCSNEERIAFAQYLEDLLPIVPTGPLDEEYIADFLVKGEHSGDRTPFANIRRLMPGEALVFEPDSVIRSRPWDWRRVGRHPKITFQDAADTLLVLLRQAVDSCVTGQAKVWCELSGGLDSSTIASLAHPRRKTNLEALTMVYPETEEADETDWVSQVLDHYPMPWHRLDADSLPPFSSPPTRFLSEPSESLLNEGLLQTYRRMAADSNVSAILSGEGGDAVFVGEGAEPFYWADYLLAGSLTALWRSSRTWAKASATRRSFVYWLRRYAFTPAWRFTCGQSIYTPEVRELPNWFDPAYIRKQNLEARRQNRSDIPRMRPGRQFQAACVAGSAHSVRAGYRNQKEPFQFRFPLLHRPLVEFMFAVPWKLKLEADANRMLQRHALRGILPEKIRVRRDKQGPTKIYFEGLRRSQFWVDLLTRQPRLVERGYVVKSVWQDTVQKMRYGVAPSLKDFLSSAILEAWLQQLETRRDSFAVRCESASTSPFRPAQTSG